MPAYGWDPGEPSFCWKSLVDNVTCELSRLRGFYESALSSVDARELEGTGVLKDAHTVEVAGRSYTSERILLAVGGKPWVPTGIEGHELAITSDQVFWLEDFPQRILIVGSGYIGTEFAGIFKGLGAEVHQSYRSEMVLPGFDSDLRKALTEEMENSGVCLHSGDSPVKLEKTDDGSLRVTMKSGSELTVDQVLMATGRVPRVDGIGLDEVGVEIGSRGEVVVDKGFRTSVDSIYAVGDCIRRYELTPVAIAEGRALAEHFFNNKPLDFSYPWVATAVFSSPPAGTVGYTEERLRELGVRFDVYRARFRPMKYTLPDKPNRAMLKLLIDPDRGTLLCCHLLGNDTPELIEVLAVCMTAGATKEDLDRTFAVHPTLSEELVLFRSPTEVVAGDVSAHEVLDELRG